MRREQLPPSSLVSIVNISLAPHRVWLVSDTCVFDPNGYPVSFACKFSVYPHMSAVFSAGEASLCCTARSDAVAEWNAITCRGGIKSAISEPPLLLAAEVGRLCRRASRSATR